MNLGDQYSLSWTITSRVTGSIFYLPAEQHHRSESHNYLAQVKEKKKNLNLVLSTDEPKFCQWSCSVTVPSWSRILAVQCLFDSIWLLLVYKPSLLTLSAITYCCPSLSWSLPATLANICLCMYFISQQRTASMKLLLLWEVESHLVHSCKTPAKYYFVFFWITKYKNAFNAQ